MESTSSHVRVIVGVMLCSVPAPPQDVTGQLFRPPKFWSCPQNCSCFGRNGIQHWPLPGSTPPRKDPGRSPWMEKNPRVECIGSGLTQIPVEEIMDDVEMLFMSSNNIPKISLADLKKFKNSKILNLKRNKIRFIIADADTTLTNATTLTLRFNEIAFLSKEHFQSFPNLKHLSQPHHHLTGRYVQIQSTS